MSLPGTPPSVSALRGGRLRTRLRMATALLTGALLITLMGVTLLDVAGRYLFNSPLRGSSEYTELLLLAIVYAGLPAICLDDGHITVDLFTSGLTGKAKMFQISISRIFVMIALSIIAWQLWAYGDRLGLYGETTVFLRAPLSPIARVMSVMAAVSAGVVALMIVFRMPKSTHSEDI